MAGKDKPQAGLVLRAINRQQAVKRLERRLAAAQNDRDEAIREALAGGWTQHHLSSALELTPGRIGQIATKGRATDARQTTRRAGKDPAAARAARRRTAGAARDLDGRGVPGTAAGTA